jgi:hypothetical protein
VSCLLTTLTILKFKGHKLVSSLPVTYGFSVSGLLRSCQSLMGPHVMGLLAIPCALTRVLC